MATTPVSVRLDEPLKARVRSLADQRRRPVHWLMREAIEQYVTREEQREAFRQEALDTWESFQSTGLHVTGAEADAWLAELEAGNDVEPPERISDASPRLVGTGAGPCPAHVSFSGDEEPCCSPTRGDGDS